MPPPSKHSSSSSSFLSCPFRYAAAQCHAFAAGSILIIAGASEREGCIVYSPEESACSTWTDSECAVGETNRMKESMGRAIRMPNAVVARPTRPPIAFSSHCCCRSLLYGCWFAARPLFTGTTTTLRE